MKILIFDIETTGFLGHGHIVENGIVELDLSNGQTKILYDEVCFEEGMTNEELEKAWILKNSDLTADQVRMSTSFESQKPKIQAIIDQYPNGITAYNNTFDFGFYEDRGIKLTKKLPCPMKLSTPICKILKRGGYSYKWPKVQEAWDFFFGKTDYIEKHRGADDAVHEAQIVYELFKRGIFKI